LLRGAPVTANNHNTAALGPVPKLSRELILKPRKRSRFRRKLGRSAMKSGVIKRSVAIAGHKTSVTLEDGFWQALHDIADAESCTLSHLLGEIDGNRQSANLSSHIRLYVLDHYRRKMRKIAICGLSPRP
jgi:predicted DNA-binding ribbon-helix-helix protein